MEHAEALDSHAADLYVLGELSDETADAFEDHFFECAVCADEVRVGMNFLDGGRRMMRQQPTTPATNVVPIAARRRTNIWLPIAAAAMLVVLIGGPLLISRAKAPVVDVGTLQTIDLSGVRSETAAPTPTFTVKDGETIVLLGDIPPEPAYVSYDVRVVDAKGNVVHSQAVSPEQAKNSLPVVLRGLGAGTYELVIIGDGPAGQHAQVARTPFIVKRQGST